MDGWFLMDAQDDICVLRRWKCHEVRVEVKYQEQHPESGLLPFTAVPYARIFASTVAEH